MYFRQMLRTPLCGIKAVRLLRPVFRIEVAYIKTNLLLLVTLSSVRLLAEAGHSTTCPSSRPAGQVAVGNLQSQPQVWVAAGFTAGTWPFPPVWASSPSLDPQRPLCSKSDEVRLAEEASKKYGSPAPTIFSKVIDKSIPADIIYEDEKVKHSEMWCWCKLQCKRKGFGKVLKNVLFVFISVWLLGISVHKLLFISWSYPESPFQE